uniref:MH2 domain-containing protein n=1 Tax=Caenorhabditis japonica TaxID=281687 RepID=A0A8R1I2C4_CAEJA
MHRAYDPGQTIREKGLRNLQFNHAVVDRFSDDTKREMENGVSRSSLVHGTQTNPNSDTWYDTDAFLLDQVKEVLNKLGEGSIDDEIWGKIVIMERCRRVAKAYLRKTTVIIDGSEDEFDGKTLGFNHFDNSARDEHTMEIRAKIADGVILKMDYQGNIKGMARGAAPIICPGWKEPRNNCISDRLVRLHGKLNHGVSEDEKAYKVFDMRKFKHSLERELHDGTPDARSLLLKTCLRIALVKDGADMNRTPCWFTIVNLVALDMVKEKIPQIKSLLNGNALPVTKSPQPAVAPDTTGLDAQTLTQIIAAAVTQANKGTPAPTNNNNSGNLSISPEQLAQIASTISIAQTNTLRTADLAKKERSKKPYHFSTSSLDSSGEDSSGRRSEASTVVKSRAKRWEQVQKSNERERSPDLKVVDKTRTTRAHRPLLQDAIFTRSHSITSDYDSNKEHFDSGSWSSTQSRYKGGRSTSSSVVSEHELAALTRDELKETSEIREANAVSEDDEPPTNPPSPAPVPVALNVPTLPRKDYNPSSPTPTPEHVVPSFTFTAASESSALSSERITEGSSPLPSPPPPLPSTPQPNNNGHPPNASLQYNHQNNNVGSFTRAAARRWKFTSVEARPSPILTTAERARSSANCVLEQRTNGMRISRNHSQPAAVHPNWQRPYQPTNSRPHTINSIERNSPERARSQLVASSSQQVPRGLRRTPNPQYQQQQQQPRDQRPPAYNYGQSTLCREPALVSRVNRTGSLPWAPWQNVRRTHM